MTGESLLVAKTFSSGIPPGFKNQRDVVSGGIAFRETTG
jgi:hypothetical protein